MIVLNVEDDVFKHTAIKKQLASLGLSDVLWVQDLESAKEVVSANEADIIVTDMSFPARLGEPESEASGEDLVAYASEHAPGTPVIVISSMRMSKIDSALGVVHYDPNEVWEPMFAFLIKEAVFLRQVCSCDKELTRQTAAFFLDYTSH